jgi:hypothetical protein
MKYTLAGLRDMAASPSVTDAKQSSCACKSEVFSGIMLTFATMKQKEVNEE